MDPEIIQAFVQANIDNPAVIRQAMEQYRISPYDISVAMNVPLDQVATYFYNAGIVEPWMESYIPYPPTSDGPSVPVSYDNNVGTAGWESTDPDYSTLFGVSDGPEPANIPPIEGPNSQYPSAPAQVTAPVVPTTPAITTETGAQAPNGVPPTPVDPWNQAAYEEEVAAQENASLAEQGLPARPTGGVNNNAGAVVDNNAGALTDANVGNGGAAVGGGGSGSVTTGVTQSGSTTTGSQTAPTGTTGDGGNTAPGAGQAGQSDLVGPSVVASAAKAGDFNKGSGALAGMANRAAAVAAPQVNYGRLTPLQQKMGYSLQGGTVRRGMFSV